MNELSRRGLVLGGVAGAASLVRPLQALSQPADTELTFFTIGDWGRHGKDQQRTVACAMENWRRALRPKFIMTVGDNFYQVGLGWPFEHHWRTSWEGVYSDDLRKLPWVAALGNHDYWGDLSAQLRYRDANPYWQGQGSHYYVYQPWMPQDAQPQPLVYPATTKDDLKPHLIDIFVLDTSVIEYPYFGASFGRGKRSQLQWLDDELRASKAEWKLVFGHHPVFSGGRHGRAKVVADKLQPILEDRDVQAYVSGHDHDLQHIVQGNRKYPHYILTGGGSRIADRRNEHGVPGGTVFNELTAGFTVFQIRGDTMHVAFVDYKGQCLHRAAVPKTVATTPPRELKKTPCDPATVPANEKCPAVPPEASRRASAFARTGLLG